MSSNFIVNTTNTVNKKYSEFDYALKKVLKNKNQLKKNISENIKNKKNLVKINNLEKSYKQSLILLEKIKKQTNDNTRLVEINNAHTIITSILSMKKKFLIIPSHVFSIIQ